MCEHKTATIIDDLRYCADCGWFIDEVCPACKKEPLACQCPTINRGSFAVDKGEDIREGIYRILIDQNCYTDSQRLEWEKGMPDKILEYLHSRGFIRKVKCPDCAWGQVQRVVGMTPCYSCNSTGYITEPIIEESNDTN